MVELTQHLIAAVQRFLWAIIFGLSFLANTAVASSFSGHQGTIAALAISPDGNTLVSAGHDGGILLWNVADGVLRGKFSADQKAVLDVAFHPDGHHLVSSGVDGSIRLWNVAKLALDRIVGKQELPARSIAISRDGRFVVSGHDQRLIYQWRLADGERVAAVQPVGMEVVTRLVYAKDGNAVYAAAQSEDVRHNPLQPNNEGMTFSLPGKTVSGALALAGDDSVLVAGGNEGQLFLLSPKSRGVLRQWIGHARWVTGIAMSNSAPVVVSGSNDALVKVWRAEAPGAIRVFAGHDAPVTAVAVTPDGKLAYSGDDDGTIVAWDVEKGLERYRLSPSLNGKGMLNSRSSDRFAAAMDSLLAAFHLAVKAARNESERVESLAELESQLKLLSMSGSASQAVDRLSFAYLTGALEMIPRSGLTNANCRRAGVRILAGYNPSDTWSSNPTMVRALEVLTAVCKLPQDPVITWHGITGAPGSRRSTQFDE